MANITIPDFPFSGHYYPEILEDLIRFLRANVPELTDEDPSEPHIQLLRAYALAAHLNNTLIDVVANEMFLPTAKLRSSHSNLLALIGVQLKQAAPASADILYQLTRQFSSTTTIIRAKSSFSTLESQSTPVIDFEAIADKSTVRTDRLDKCYAYDAGAATWADHTTAAQVPAGSFSPAWGTIAAGDLLLIGHPDILWDRMDINVAVGATGITGTWEYYDGNLDQGNPTSVTNTGSTLKFDVNSILGTANRSGTTVRVRSNVTGAYKDLLSTFAAGQNLVETSASSDPFLGQTTPSTQATDYTVGTAWREFTSLVDSTNNFSLTGKNTVTFTLPQTLAQNWRTKAEGAGAVTNTTQYWARYRVIATSSPTAPTISEIQITEGQQYQVVGATQGKSREDKPLASSDAAPNQAYAFTNSPVIDDVNLRVYVDESSVEKEYTRVDNFLSSLPTDRHITVSFDDDGVATVTFGDGVLGRIPPAGVDNVRAEYRTMAEIDGNVGAETITVNRSGVANITKITNPRAATGFAVREGSTTADLARIKISGPATLRTLQRGVGVLDIEQLCTDFVAADGSRPVQRALAVEDANGPKTVEIVVVGAGGDTVQASKLSEIQDFFNGTEAVKGRLLLNYQSTAVNFTQKSVAITATVDGGNLSAIRTALIALLNPLLANDDGTYVWAFGGLVPRARIIHAIMDTDPPPRNVTLTTPASDVALGGRELPISGTLTITVNP